MVGNRKFGGPESSSACDSLRQRVGKGEFRRLHLSGLLRGVLFSFCIQLREEFFKLGLLFRREDRTDLVASFLTDLLDLHIRLIVNRFRLSVAL